MCERARRWVRDGKGRRQVVVVIGDGDGEYGRASHYLRRHSRIATLQLRRTHTCSNMIHAPLTLFVIGAHAIVANGFTIPVPICMKPSTSTKCRQLEMMSKKPEIMASAVTKTLYPASMIGVLGELYFRTRNEMECPRGAVSSYHARIDAGAFDNYVTS